MQFTEEHVNKRFQAYRFLDCVFIIYFFVFFFVGGWSWGGSSITRRGDPPGWHLLLTKPDCKMSGSLLVEGCFHLSSYLKHTLVFNNKQLNK